MPITDCSAAGLANANPCLQCASDSELDMLWFYLWAYFGGYDLSTDLNTLLARGRGLEQLSDKQVKEAKIALFANFLGLGDVTMAEILEDVKCLPCVEPKVVRAATLSLICQFLTLAP